MSMDRQIYSLSISGDENKARGLLGIGRKLLGMASEDMRKNNVDSWKHRLHSNDGNVRIDVLARADGNNKISIAYLSPGPEEPEPPKTRRLLLHCRIELTLCKEIPNYEKDPAYITVEPIPIPEGDEAENYKVRFHVFYDVGGQFELILKEEDEDDPDRDEKDKYQIPGTLSMEDAIPEVEKFTGYTHLEKIVDPAYPFSESLFTDPQDDYKKVEFPTDEWMNTRPTYEGYDTKYRPASSVLPLSSMRHTGPINIRKFSYQYNDEEFTENICDLYQLSQHWEDHEDTGVAHYSEETGLRNGIRSECINHISTPSASQLVDSRHIPLSGSVATDKKSYYLTDAYFDTDNGWTYVTYYIDASNYVTYFSYYVETQSSVEIMEELGEDFIGIDGTFYKHKKTNAEWTETEYVNLFDRLFNKDVYYWGMNWLTFPSLQYSLPQDLADVGEGESDISESPLSSPGTSRGISAPGAMVLELRSFFANTNAATSRKMKRKSYQAEWSAEFIVDTYWDEVEEKRYYKHGYRPLEYTRSEEPPAEIEIELSQDRNPSTCPNFITEKYDLVDVGLLSSIYAIGRYEKLTKELVDISDRYDGDVDLSYVTEWGEKYYLQPEEIQKTTGKRPWPKYLDCEKWEYVNAYACGVAVRDEYSLIYELEARKYLEAKGFPLEKDRIRGGTSNIIVDALKRNKSPYEAGDGSTEPASAESVIVNAIYRHLEEHGYDRYAPVCDIRLEAELYDKYE